MSTQLSISIAICSADRTDELALALESLKIQSFQDFEIICVLGPGSEVSKKLREHFQNLTIINTNEHNLSYSRNLALKNCKSEIIAFLDDDARAEPSWVEQIRMPFFDPKVGVVGGWTRDRGGENWQVLNVATDILGRNTFSNNQINSDFLSENRLFRTPRPQGANCAFRVEPLVRAGGFDDYLVWNYDEVEATFRVLEIGYLYKNNSLAVVHHYTAASKMRTKNGIPLDNYYIWRSRSYFTIKRSTGLIAQSNIMRVIFEEFDHYKRWLTSLLLVGELQEDHCRYLFERGLQGITDGLKDGFDEALNTFKKESLKIISSKNEIKRKNVVLVTPEWYGETNGGIGLWYESLAKELAKQGHQVHLLGIGNTERVFKNGFWQIRVNGGWHHIPGNDFLTLEPLKSANQASLREEIVRINQVWPIDCVMVSNWGSMGLGLNGPWKLIISIHTSKNLTNEIALSQGLKLHPMDELEARLEIESLRHADLIVSSSEGTIEHYRAPDFMLPQVVKIPLGIVGLDEGSIPEECKLLTCKNEHFLFIGRNEPRKNPELAIKIVSEFHRVHSQKIGLILIGDGTEVFEQVESSVSPCIHGLGGVSENEKIFLLLNSLALLITSKYESFGLTALEAMSLAKIVIANNVGGLSETVLHNETGFLFNEQEILIVVEHCWSIFIDPVLRERLEINAKARFVEHFTIKKNVLSLIDGAF